MIHRHRNRVDQGNRMDGLDGRWQMMLVVSLCDPELCSLCSLFFVCFVCLTVDCFSPFVGWYRAVSDYAATKGITPEE